MNDTSPYKILYNTSLANIFSHENIDYTNGNECQYT